MSNLKSEHGFFMLPRGTCPAAYVNKNLELNTKNTTVGISQTHVRNLIQAPHQQIIDKDVKMQISEDFSGDPVAKTLRSQCMGPGFHPRSRN